MAAELRLLAGRYRLRDRIGAGAMGVVWKADDQSLERQVAVKELILPHSPDPAQATGANARAMREARIAARLMHPNSVAVFDVVEQDGRPWLIMEYLPSTSLAEVLAQQGSLPPAQVAGLGSQIASALAAAHQSGIVHRDIKPANVLIGADGVAKITDFGISRAAGDVTVTTTGIVAGTPSYFAPEVAQGHDADFRSDVFSLGATLYHATEGSPPFGLGPNAIALLHRVASGEFEPPKQADELAPVLLRLLTSEPDHRPDMAGAATALTDLTARMNPAPDAVAAADPAPATVTAAAEPTHQALAEDTPTRPRPPARRWLVVWASLVVLLAGIASAVWLSTGEDPRGPSPTGTAAPPPASTPPSPPPAQPNRDQQLAATVEDYYALIPGKLDVAYARLSDRFKQERSLGLASYRSFWSQWSQVHVSKVAVRDNTVSATITYLAPGRTIVERDLFTLAQGPGGSWQIDNQSSGG